MPLLLFLRRQRLLLVLQRQPGSLPLTPLRQRHLRHARLFWLTGSLRRWRLLVRLPSLRQRNLRQAGLPGIIKDCLLLLLLLCHWLCPRLLVPLRLVPGLLLLLLLCPMWACRCSLPLLLLCLCLLLLRLLRLQLLRLLSHSIFFRVISKVDDVDVTPACCCCRGRRLLISPARCCRHSCCPLVAPARCGGRPC